MGPWEKRLGLLDALGVALLASSLALALLLGHAPLVVIEGPVYSGVARLYGGWMRVMGVEQGIDTFALSSDMYLRVLVLGSLNLAALLIVMAARRRSDAVLVLSFTLTALITSYSLVLYRFYEAALQVYSSPASSYRIHGGTLLFPPHHVSFFKYGSALLAPALSSAVASALLAIPRLRIEAPRLGALDYAGIAAGLVFFAAFLATMLYMRIPVSMPQWAPGPAALVVDNATISIDQRFAGGVVEGGAMIIDGEERVQGVWRGGRLVFSLPRHYSEERTLTGSPSTVSVELELRLGYPTCTAEYVSAPMRLIVPVIKPRFNITMLGGKLRFQAPGYPASGILELRVHWLRGSPPRTIGEDVLEKPGSTAEIPVQGDYARVYVRYIYLGRTRILGTYVYPEQ